MWQENGDRSAAHWVARATRTTVSKAAECIETAKRLEDLPRTAEAFQKGIVSETQVREIASAATMDPSFEERLLSTARSGDVTALRDQCRRVRSAAITDEVERYEAIHRSRYLRSWSDHDGAFRLDARLTSDAGATVMAALEPHRRTVFEDARRAGTEGPTRGLPGGCSCRFGRKSCRSRDSGPVRTPSRGPRPGGSFGPCSRIHERRRACEIPGVGPVPVASVRALASDAILAAVVTDGVDIKTVAHLGRTIPARLRTALQARDTECAVSGCHNRYRLEIDHIKQVTDGGPTSLDNLVKLCRPHHHMKTNLGFRLIGRPGRWEWIAPNESNGKRRSPDRRRAAEARRE